MADGQVVFEIKGDASNVNQTVKQVTGNIQQESKKWDQAVSDATDSAGKSFSNWKLAATAAVTAIGAALVNFGKQAIQTASDLQEVQNVVDTVFGSGANQIEAWAKKAGTQFGLTELQAKKFTSTLGAMMKSSGLAGDEIISMSTDLAGLAADMASFYNLDFETAFEKIRSGISGETMPLKQLGINMSVANLEAYALAQGLNKTFSEMSQGEQTMLRYQYLMQATSDAQGDFAKTADSFENAKRTITTALNTISATVGTFILDTVNPLVSGLASVLTKITAPQEETLFDKIANIEMDTTKKIAEIDSVAATAQNLIDKLMFISGTDAGDALAAMASGANKLDASAPTTWKAVMTSLQNIDGLENIFTNNAAGSNIEDLANALSSSEVDSGKAEAWKTFLGALSDNADAVSKLTGKSVEETAAWLSQMAEAVNGIDASDAEAWDSLLTTLVQGFSADTPEGQQFIEGLAAQFLALGSDSDVATKGLEALGFSSEQIADKQKEWLKTCKELVQTIPGLSGVINTETGAIDGGIGALEDYYKEWQETQKKIALWKAYYAKVDAYNENQASLYSKQVTAGGAQISLDNYIANNPNSSAVKAYQRGGILALKDEGTAEARELMSLVTAAKDAQKDYNTSLSQGEEEAKKLKDEYQYLQETIGELTDEEVNGTKAAEEATDEMTLLQKALEGDDEAAKSVADQWTKAGEALKAVADYYASVESATRSAVDSVLDGFSSITTAWEEYDTSSKDLASQETELLNKYADVWNKWGSDNTALNQMKEYVDKGGKLTDTENEAYEALVKVRNAQTELNESMQQYSPDGMAAGLNDQIAYMEEYLQNLNTLQEWGVSQEMLASLSDGSTDSAAYLKALVDGGSDAAVAVGDLYDEVQQKKEAFTTALTEQKLAADESYQGLVDSATEALSDLDMHDSAQTSMADTVQGIADGINDKLPAVQTAVQSVIDELNRLNSFGINYQFDSSGSLEVTFGNVQQFASGTDWIPRNHYPAYLDYGEAVLTAEENKIWQMFKTGQQPTGMDYGALGGVMRDNVKAGGDVYLEGRVVGQVVSDIQGRNYRTLKRSGWQG